MSLQSIIYKMKCNISIKFSFACHTYTQFYVKSTQFPSTQTNTHTHAHSVYICSLKFQNFATIYMVLKLDTCLAAFPFCIGHISSIKAIGFRFLLLARQTVFSRILLYYICERIDSDVCANTHTRARAAQEIQSTNRISTNRKEFSERLKVFGRVYCWE